MYGAGTDLERRTAALLAVQTEVSNLLAGADSLEAVAPEILRILGEQLRWDACALWIVDSAADRLRLLASRYSSAIDAQVLVDGGWEQSSPLGEGLVGRAWEEVEPRWLSDVTRREDFSRAAAARAQQLTTGVWVPVAAGGEVLGVLELFSREARERDERVLVSMEALGRQLGQFLGRVHARVELVEAKEQMERVLQSVGEGVLAVEPAGRIELVNPRAEELLGRGAGELLGRPVSEILRLVDEKSGREIPSPPPVVPEKLRRVHYRAAILLGGAGRETFIDVTWSPMVDARGRLRGLVAALSDVTERRLEEKRVALRAQAVELLESSLDYESTIGRVAELAAGDLGDWCAVFLAEDDRVRRVAAAYGGAEMHARVEELFERFPPDVSAPVGASHVIRTGESELHPEVGDEVLAEMAGGPDHLEILRSLELASMIAVPLFARERVLGAMVLASHDPERRYDQEDLELAQDLADRAALAIDNVRQYVAAREALAARDEFVSIVSHELKSPLATLDFSLQAMARFDEDEHAQRTAQMTRRHVGRMKRLIDNLLEGSRITAGRLSLEREPCDLGELVRRSAERLAAQCERAGCELRIQVGDPARGMWDPLRIDQIVSNLLSNAIKYGKGEPIDVVLERRDETARIKVSDRGIGIVPGNLKRIFGRFERAGKAGDARTGVGLGLWIVLRTVDAMGGEVGVDSRPGEGSEFTVELPIEAEHAAES